MTANGNVLDLTPSPRLLEVIGDLDLAPWQCLAELIDNAFDEFLHDTDRGPDESPPEIEVTLPRESTQLEDACVAVIDNGRGMDLDSMQQALRAGYSGNERFGNLGMFGMGFNVATARLGNLTEVRSTRKGEPHWLVVRIDLRALQRHETFKVPVEREPKDDLNFHGTQVIVRQLRKEMFENLRRSAAKTSVRNILGDIYSYLLRTPGQVPFADGTAVDGARITLKVGSVQVQPRLPCAWEPERMVRVKGADVPAIIKIDVPLKPAQACMNCGHWTSVEVDACTECKSDQLQWRERKVWGWIGIQRYLDKSDFGLDFLREGRKVLRRDKTIFSWIDPETDISEPEYPIELGGSQGGRIIGEIHLDHVAVSYRKHDFVRDSRDWKTATNYLRGEAPLQPIKARQRGYPENSSPLARLYSAFRRNDPGLRCLIPGDSAGNGPIHERTREWGQRFRRGDAPFQTDEVWYAAAAAYDRAKGLISDDDESAPTDEATRQIFIEAGLGDPDAAPTVESVAPPDGGSPEDTSLSGDQPAEATSATPPVETDAERFDRIREKSHKYIDMLAEITLPFMGKVAVEVYGTSGTPLMRDGGRVPSLAWVPSGGRVEVFVDEDHEVFREFGRDPRDYALVEMALVIRGRNQSQAPLTSLMAEITRQFPDQRMTATALLDRVTDLLTELRTRMSDWGEQDMEELWAVLPQEEKEKAERSAQRTSPHLDWAQATSNGGFVGYIAGSGLAALVREVPEKLLDGRVFRTRYASWSDPDVQAKAAERIAADLVSLDAFLGEGSVHDRDALMRVQLTERTLRDELSRE